MVERSPRFIATSSSLLNGVERWFGYVSERPSVAASSSASPTCGLPIGYFARLGGKVYTSVVGFPD